MGRFARLLGLAMTMLVILLASGCGYRGRVYVRNPDGSIGETIEGAKLTFMREGSDFMKTVESGPDGTYQIRLNKGRYWVRATHPDYEDYTTRPGFFVVSGGGYQTGNIFLRAPRVTTVLIVRHGEKANGTGDVPLNDNGEERAEKLAHVLWKAGVTAIYSSNYLRTRSTAQPLAESLKLDVTTYTDPASLAQTILANHAGDVVLAVGHSNTVHLIAQELGGSMAQLGDEYDNLIVVTVYQPNEAQVVNLQYGEESGPDMVRGTKPLKTVLLVRNVEAGEPGLARAQQLVHVVRTAGVSTVFGSPTSDPSVQAVGQALNEFVVSYDPADLQPLADQVLLDTARVFVIAGDGTMIKNFINVLKATPVPPVYSGEYDNLYVITTSGDGSCKLVNLQYGEPDDH